MAFSTAMSETLTLTSETVRVNGWPAEATLLADELRWRPAASGGGCGERRLDVESEVLDVKLDGTKVIFRAFVEAEATQGLSCVGGGGGKVRGDGRRARRDFVLEMETAAAAARWVTALRDRVNSLGRPKRLFILVNPFGGQRCARTILQTEVLPLIDAACILHTVQETKYRLHAQEIAHSLDLRKYDGIICVSGDGVLVEVVNGLLQRDDWDTAIKVPLGIIPAGTGNGMIKSLLHSAGDSFSVSNAVFAIIRGHKRALDVTSIVQGKTKFFSVLMLTWGLVADVDIESEKYRWMGSARLDFYTLLRVINLRRYTGRVLFVPAAGYEGVGEPVKQIDNYKCNGDSTLIQEDQTNNCNVESCGYAGPSVDLTVQEWRSLGGPFVSVWINNVPWAGEDIMPAPEAKFADGYLDAVILKDCPKSALLGLMLKMGDGSYVKSPYVTYIKVKAFRVEPGPRVGSNTKGGIIDSDGEVIARGDRSGDGQEHIMAYGPPIQMTVDQGLATIFSPSTGVGGHSSQV